MDKISKALVKAQKEFAPALKTNTNPHFRSKYVGLDGCIEAVIDALNNNGIMLMQKNHPYEHGVSVETVFIHESGESISGGILSIPATKLDAQGYGSALTYARRYSLMAACGIAPEDDDGNMAVRAVQPPKESAKPIAKDVWENLPLEEQNFLTGIAIEITEHYLQGNMEKCISLVHENNLDAEEQIALWSRLDSKQRSAIKSYKDSLKKVA